MKLNLAAKPTPILAARPKLVLAARPNLIVKFALACLLAVAFAGCDSPGEKKYDEAKMLWKRGMEAEAIAAYEEAASLLVAEGGEAGRAWEKLGTIYKGYGQQDEAIAYYLKSIEDDPTKFDRHRKLMRSYSLSNRFDEARQVYRDLMEDPGLSQELRFRHKDRQELEEAYELIDEEQKEYERAMAEAAEEESAAPVAEAVEEEAQPADAEADPDPAAAEDAEADEPAEEDANAS